MSELNPDRLLDLATQLTEAALRAGADVAEAQARGGWELTARVRLGETDLIQEAGHSSLYLRAFKDGRVALTSTSDLSDSGRKRCVEDAIELLQLSEQDPFAGPADPSLLAVGPFDDLELYDPRVEQLDAPQAIEKARQAEGTALALDDRISLSEGATVSRVSASSALVLSTGFSNTQSGSYVSVNVAPVAMDADGKRRRGYYWDARRHLADLASMETVGKEAGRRTLRQLGARKLGTCQAPVIFESDVARSIIGTFAGCILGGALWRKSSYLLGKLSERVASPLVTIVDDPLILRGPGSRTTDGEGLSSQRNIVVEDGVLNSYLLDSYSARKLNMQSTHSASRSGASVGPSTSNLALRPGTLSAQDLIRDTPRGLYVTEMMGFGFNAVNGDFSRGAAGFWIENGELQYPVNEITISGNLDEMLKHIDAVANDLDMKTSVAAPSFRISQMTIAGQ
jgi:PmbA protein